MTQVHNATSTPISSWPPRQYERLWAFMEAILPPSVSLTPQERERLFENTVSLIDGLHTPLKRGYVIGLLLLDLMGLIKSGKRYPQLSVTQRRELTIRLASSRLLPVSQLYGFMAGLALVDFYSLPRVWEALDYDPYVSKERKVELEAVANDDY